MANPALNAIGFILGILFNLYATAVAVRFVMQVVQADYYNPLAQALVKITDPALIPLRRIIPSIKRYDTASLILCFAVLLLKLFIFKFLSLGYVDAMGHSLIISGVETSKLVTVAFLDLIHHFFNVFIYALIIQAVLSWIPGAASNPVNSLVSSISEPALRPLRNKLPHVADLNLTLFFTIIALFALRIFLLGTLQQLFDV